ncbi:MAG TPA: hypothetical protein DCQ06_14770 [Myxococcales bacterium]|nr:hypothetical protein [Myxococcales bacterium]
MGELAVPPNAELVLARTWTVDGREVAPAETPDKTTLSLREVMPGAVVEYVQVQFMNPTDSVTGATRAPPFLLRSRDGPTLQSRFEVLDTPHCAVLAQASPNAPAPQRVAHGQWRLRTWTMKEAPSFRLEGDTPRPAWQLPAVQASTYASKASVQGPWNELLARYRRQSTPSLTPWILRAKQAHVKPNRWRELLHSLFASVGHQRPSSAPQDPALAIQRGRGDRASLIWLLAKEASVQACLVRAVPWHRQMTSNRHQWSGYDHNDYALSAVALKLGSLGNQRWYWVDVNAGLFDGLRPTLRARPALALGCEQGNSWRTTPTLNSETTDSRQVQVDLTWGLDGSYRATVTDRISGALVAAVRRMRKRNPKTLLRQLSSLMFPLVKARWSPDSTTLDESNALVLRYSVQAPADRRRQNRIHLGLTPYRLGRRYGRSASRQMRLLVSHDVNLQLNMTVTTPKGTLRAQTHKIPQHRLLKMKQHIAGQDSSKLVIEHRFNVQSGLVEAVDYPGFAYAARSADRAEILGVEREVLPRKRPSR